MDVISRRAFDPLTGWVYETETRSDSCFYRFRPGDVRPGGAMEALVLTDIPMADTRATFQHNLGVPLRAHWVKITAADRSAEAIHVEARGKGAALFNGGGGAWHGSGRIHFVSARGGAAGTGQVFAYDPVAGRLTLLVDTFTRLHGGAEMAISGRGIRVGANDETGGESGSHHERRHGLWGWP